MRHKFNGVDVRTPTSFSWDIEDIETSESGMTLDGVGHSDLLAQKRILTYSWADPTAEETSHILQLINQKIYVTVTYPDAESGQWETREFKATKRNAPFRDLRVGKRIYTSLSLGFRER